MKNQKFYNRFTTITLLMGTMMVLAGRLMRPVELEDTFDITTFNAVYDHITIWIWSYRFLVFGLFLQIMGLAAFKALMRNHPDMTILLPGIIVCILALFISSLSEGYYMHIGGWGGWKITQLGEPGQAVLMENLDLSQQWIICLTRMGYMFFCLGLIAIGWALLSQKHLKRITGIYALIVGMMGILFMMIYDKSTAIYVPVQYAILIFFILLAGSVGQKERTVN